MEAMEESLWVLQHFQYLAMALAEKSTGMPVLLAQCCTTFAQSNPFLLPHCKHKSECLIKNSPIPLKFLLRDSAQLCCSTFGFQKMTRTFIVLIFLWPWTDSYQLNPRRTAGRFAGSWG